MNFSNLNHNFFICWCCLFQRIKLRRALLYLPSTKLTLYALVRILVWFQWSKEFLWHAAIYHTCKVHHLLMCSIETRKAHSLDKIFHCFLFSKANIWEYWYSEICLYTSPKCHHASALIFVKSFWIIKCIFWDALKDTDFSVVQINTTVLIF